jgi:hypothetical protein
MPDPKSDPITKAIIVGTFVQFNRFSFAISLSLRWVFPQVLAKDSYLSRAQIDQAQNLP